MEFVLGRFSHFYIAIAYSNSTFCGAWTPSICEFTWKLSNISGKRAVPLIFYVTVAMLLSICKIHLTHKVGNRLELVTVNLHIRRHPTTDRQVCTVVQVSAYERCVSCIYKINFQELVRGLIGVRVGNVLLLFYMSELNGVTHYCSSQMHLVMYYIDYLYLTLCTDCPHLLIPLSIVKECSRGTKFSPLFSPIKQWVAWQRIEMFTLV